MSKPFFFQKMEIAIYSISEKEVIHILKILNIIGGMTRDTLYSFVGSGYLNCNSVTLRVRSDDYPHLIAAIDITRVVFDTLVDLQTWQEAVEKFPKFIKYPLKTTPEELRLFWMVCLLWLSLVCLLARF